MKEKSKKEHKDDAIQLCICGHIEPNRKSFFGKIDTYVGLVVLIGISFALLFLKAWELVPIVILLAFFVVLILALAKRLQRHSLSCAIRWGAIVVFGSLGGFGVFSM